jgi:hypothetical protein
MPANYVLLEKITVGAAGASSVTFSGIPQTGYTDLVVKCSVRETATNSGISLCKINSATTNYSGRELVGNGGGGTSYSDTNYGGSGGFGQEGTSGISAATNTFSSSEWYFPNYTSSNYKSISIDGVNERDASSVQYMALGAYLWSDTSAINTLTFAPYSGTYAQHSTLTLYGVAKLNTTPAIAPKATGGNTIMTDGTYWYHAFRGSGTFTPSVALSCDYLVIAGGGGGGNAGGGAGGYRLLTSQSLTATGYSVTVGAGGAGGVPGVAGSNSVFNSITSTGGGGGAVNGGNAGNGGSGGGSSVVGTTVGTAGTGIVGQGNNGGSGTAIAPGNYVSGGGGGAGAAGGNTVGLTCGAGGAGKNSESSWASATGTGVSGYYAGGGGAAGNTTTSAGGAGGGGQGDNGTTGNGIANTGSGGGGGYAVYLGNGGSGLVIVRYPV